MPQIPHRIKHIYSTIIREVVTEQQSPKMKLRQRLLWALFVLYSTRAANLFYQIVNHFPAAHHSLDYIVHFAKANALVYDELFLLSLFLMGAFILLSQQYLYSTHPHTATWHYFYVIVVRNIELYQQCLKPLAEVEEFTQRRQQIYYDRLQCNYPFAVRYLLPKCCIRLYCLLKTRLDMWINFEHVDKVKLRQNRLPISIDVPVFLRIKLLLCIFAIERVCFYYQILVVFLFSQYSLKYVPLFSRPSLWHLPAILLDQLATLYIFYLLTCSGVYCFCCFISLYLNTQRFHYWAQVFRRLIAFHYHHKANRPTLVQSRMMLKKLDKFLREHTRISYLIVYGNGQIWSKILAVFLCTNLPSNVYFFIRLFFIDSLTRLPLFESFTIVVVFLVQTLTVLVVLLGLAKQSKALHHFAVYIIPVQQMLQSSDGNTLLLLYKIKLDQLLQRLTQGPVYGITIGPLGFVITYETIWKIATLYLYYTLVTFNLECGLQLEKNNNNNNN